MNSCSPVSLRKSNVEMVPAKTIDMLVPADADIVIEGYIEPGETCTEGPFGDHTGFYSLADEYPLLHITAITHRKNPIYQTIIVGKPPMEDCYMGKATERIFMPLIKTQLPGTGRYEFAFIRCISQFSRLFRLISDTRIRQKR